jgi:hypothetical protein
LASEPPDKGAQKDSNHPTIGLWQNKSHLSGVINHASNHPLPHPLGMSLATLIEGLSLMLDQLA